MIKLKIKGVDIIESGKPTEWMIKTLKIED